MRCSYCDISAMYKCNCKGAYICATHLGKHLDEKGEHIYENLNIDIGETALLKLREKILQNIHEVEIARKDLNIKTKWLVRQLKLMHKKAEDLFDNLIENYCQYFQNNKFCVSELTKIEEIQTTEVFVKNADFNEFKLLIEGLFPKQLKVKDRKIFIMGEKVYEEEQQKISKK